MRSTATLSTLLAFAILVVGFSEALTSTEYETIRDYVIASIRSNAPTLIHPTFVRLSFHDCVGYCDGCINLDQSDNNGLATAITAMEYVYGNVTDVEGISVSRADLWAIGGRVGAEWGMEGMPGNINFDSSTDKEKDFVSPFPTFQFGRVDCDTAPYTTTEHSFPSPHMTHDEVIDFFNGMGMSDTQTVAIMGAHTLGKCSKDNSGYNGPWVTGVQAASFDNVYWQNMLDASFTYEAKNAAGLKATGDDARPQLRCTDSAGDSCGIMLNTDFEMFYDMTLSSTTFLATCEASAADVTCSQASTYATAYSYAEDNDVWLAAYIDAYDQMTSYVDFDVTLTDLA